MFEQWIHERLAGTLSCYDRIVITGTLPGACYAAEGLTSFLPRQAHPPYLRLRSLCRASAGPHPAPERRALAAAQGVQIEHIAKAHLRKEEVIAAEIKRRGDHPSLVHILSAMEACNAYEPWHDKRSHQTFLRHTSGKCLHYYFIDNTLGLIYLRYPAVPILTHFLPTSRRPP